MSISNRNWTWTSRASGFFLLDKTKFPVWEGKRTFHTLQSRWAIHKSVELMQRWTDVKCVTKVKLFFKLSSRSLLLQGMMICWTGQWKLKPVLKVPDGLWLSGRRGQSTEARNQYWNLGPKRRGDRTGKRGERRGVGLLKWARDTEVWEKQMGKIIIVPFPRLSFFLHLSVKIKKCGIMKCFE